VAPIADSYLYFTAESFYQHTIPDDCKKPESMDYPYIYFEVTNIRTNEIWYQREYEYYHNPIIIGPDSYSAGD
jgi:hypothetical protein